ncbi:unnamed protein product [Coregonus sp. 'balchen']|nr:unnamed protein product [Coregonus sp. 'balchen']
MELIAIIGNHDIGFHHEMNWYKLERFKRVFNVTSARIVTKNGVSFVLVNSMAMHGDRCPICEHVENKLYSLSQAINCSVQLFWWFPPRLILSGHTHSACKVVHDNKHPEVSVPSFSLRNRNNPSFILLARCFLPEESSVVANYCATAVSLLLMAHLHLSKSFMLLATSLMGKHKGL